MIAKRSNLFLPFAPSRTALTICFSSTRFLFKCCSNLYLHQLLLRLRSCLFRRFYSASNIRNANKFQKLQLPFLMDVHLWVTSASVIIILNPIYCSHYKAAASIGLSRFYSCLQHVNCSARFYYDIPVDNGSTPYCLPLSC